MKRIIGLLLVLIVLFTLFGCGKNGISGDSGKTVTTEKEFKKPEDETKSRQDYIDEIDGEYLEKERSGEYDTTVDMVDLADEYAAKWEEVADGYYNKLISVDGRVTLDGKEYSSKEFRKYIKDLKSKRLEEMKEETEKHRQELNDEFEGGTIIGPLMAGKNYILQMEWALELVDIYSSI